MHLVDTHQHLWDLTRFPYSWCAGNPTLNRSFRPEDYEKASSGLNITKTVFMEADVDEPHALAEAQRVQTLADQHPLIHGIVASGRPENTGFRAHLDSLRPLRCLRGIRRVLHTQPDELSAQPRFVDHLRLLPDYDLTFDLCVLPSQLPLALRLVEQLPEVTFILDHGGIPDVKGRALDPWCNDIARIAALPNVNCKISGLVAYADPVSWTTADLRPWFDHLIAVFGWDRVVWGGDWPVCTLGAPLSRWVAATHELVAGADDAARARLFHANAERLYRI